MELKEGMYVRIQWGNGEQTISRCTNKVDIGDTQYSNNDFYIHTDKKAEVIYKSMIVKASNNIIDLIEVGDYVNGLRVYGITDFGLEVYMYGDAHEILEENEIKSIVTKEQFESMSYKVE